jgi:hypothetical protein
MSVHVMKAARHLSFCVTVGDRDRIGGGRERAQIGVPGHRHRVAAVDVAGERATRRRGRDGGAGVVRQDTADRRMTVTARTWLLLLPQSIALSDHDTVTVRTELTRTSVQNTQQVIARVLADGEVTEATINSKLMVRTEGSRQVRHLCHDQRRLHNRQHRRQDVLCHDPEQAALRGHRPHRR